MRTTLNLDDHVMDELLRLATADTKTQAVTQAIQEYVRRKQLEELRQLRGRLPLRTNWRQCERGELRDLKRLERRRGSRPH